MYLLLGEAIWIFYGRVTTFMQTGPVYGVLWCTQEREEPGRDMQNAVG